MRNILLNIRFLGTAYHGWQVQKNALAIQAVLQDALEKILGSRPDVVGCSRTDAGVHAYQYFINFKTEHSIPLYKLDMAVNRFLPDDIALQVSYEVPLSFHARYDALEKEYCYSIYNGKYRNPFYKNRAFFYPYSMNIEVMREACKRYIGKMDYSAFCSVKSGLDNHVRDVRHFSVERQGDMVYFYVRADGFLCHMVRIMAGTLISCNERKIQPGDIPSIIQGKQRQFAGPTLPPCGLYLNRVVYPDGLF